MKHLRVFIQIFSLDAQLFSIRYIIHHHLNILLHDVFCRLHLLLSFLHLVRCSIILIGRRQVFDYARDVKLLDCRKRIIEIWHLLVTLP